MTATDVSAQVRTWALAEAGRQCFGEDFGIDIALNAVPTPAGVQVAYLIAASCRAPLLGQGPLFALAPLLTPPAHRGTSKRSNHRAATATPGDVRADAQGTQSYPERARMNTHKISITGTPPGCLIELDGKVTELMSLDLHLDGSSLPHLVITPPIFEVDACTEGHVTVDEKTAETLIALGWLPPTHECI